MRPTITNLLIAFIIIFILRYISLEYFPNVIINGYFSIFLCFTIASVLFTKNIFYSIILGLLAINFRVVYRSVKDTKTLVVYNSFSNCAIFTFAFILLSIFLIYFEKIDRCCSKYYGHLIVSLIIINLYSLKTNDIDSQLVCFS